MEQKDFLQEYEVKNWEFNPRIYRILGLATLLNFLIIFGVAQSNLLRTKACDGPFVGKVCQVLDTIYVGMKLFTGDKGYVVREYDKTSISDADEVIWIDETGKGPAFSYPTGYFKPEESEELLGDENLMDDTVAEVLPTPLPYIPTPRSSGNGLFGRKQRLPKRNRNIVRGDLPDDPLGNIGDDDNDGKNKKLKNDSPDKLPTLDGTTAKDKKPENKNKDEDKDSKKNPIADTTAKNSKSVDIKDIINRKPLDDFADEVLVKWQEKKVDLSSKFKIEMVGRLTKNGKLDQKRSRFVEASGDPAMVEVAKRAIESVGDSGWLTYLSDYDVKLVNFVFEQTDNKLYAIVDASLPTVEKANTVATGLRGLMQATLLLEKNGVSKLGSDEKILLKAAKVRSDGKVLKINFELPKEIAQKMINEQLKQHQAKKLKKQKDKIQPKGKPNGSAGKVNNNTNAVK